MAGDGGQRPPANRMTLQTFKTRLGGAKKGFSLLKKKRDALKARFQGILKEIVDTKLKVGEGLKEGAFALAKSHWANSSDIASTVIERCSKPSVTCSLKSDNIAGVSIPTFKVVVDASKADPATIGMEQGGAVVNATRATYLQAVQELVRLASLQTMFNTLDLEIKMTSRRVNALEYVLIPRIADICHYITQEMDEEAREEFFRVKKVVDKKKQKLEKEKIQELKERAEKEAKSAMKGAAPAAVMATPASAIPNVRDEDIVFK
eukprot:TRINITY_DN1714_c0_g1_i1.p1 TRINITY_DN1714_c0_g1~~TRINITY_DN1714_c0_g1_i1.p1  ORF type:complete len:263 (-),score=103.99 TRINITY_DN1714_c0_g1_i1:104-892(-)